MQERALAHPRGPGNGHQLAATHLEIHRPQHLGLGIAGIWATYQSSDAWIAVTIPTTAFLVLAGINHVIEMARDRNYAPGNSVIVISDLGIPITLWAMLASVGAL